MKHYYIKNSKTKKGLEEITEAEFHALFGDKTIRPYATKVYRGEITIDDVPTDYKEAVQAVVDAKIAKWGTYESRNVGKATDKDYQNALEELGVNLDEENNIE